MALEQNNTAFEFETMLRRQLSKNTWAKKTMARTSITESCAGFDADTANAYLENAIGATTRSRYESHLAGCPSCRHHVIQLARLIQLPQTEPQLTPIAKPVSIWSHWKSVVAEWLDFSAWKQGWATASLAAAILIGVVSLQLWRQQQSIQPQNEPLTLAGGTANEPTPQPSPGIDASNNGTQLDATVDGNLTQLAVNRVPTPQVSPFPLNSFATTAQPVTANSKPGSELFDLSVPPSPPQSQPVINTFFSPVAGRATAFGPPAQPISAESFAPAPPATEIQKSESVVAAHITPLPSDNPMARKPKTSDGSKLPRSSIDKALSFLPTRKTDDERKLEEKEIDPDAPKVLSIRRRDKVFNHQSGFWVDSAYKSEMAWRVTKVVFDSEEYKQLLAAEPLLKEYFAHGPAIVVWKDKIYKAVIK